MFGELCKYNESFYFNPVLLNVNIATYLKNLQVTERESFERLLQIAKYVQNNNIDSRKF